MTSINKTCENTNINVEINEQQASPDNCLIKIKTDKKKTNNPHYRNGIEKQIYGTMPKQHNLHKKWKLKYSENKKSKKRNQPYEKQA